MSFLSPETAYGLVGLVVLIIFALASGFGLLFLCGFPEDRRSRFILAPVAITIFWSLTGDILVRLGLTMAQLALPMWILSALLALVAAWAALRDPRSALDVRLVVLPLAAGVITVFVLLPLVRPGLFSHLGSPNTDTFLYTSFAVSYWQTGLTIDTANSWFFAPFAPFQAYLAGGRNHTFVLLAFLSPLVEAGEPMFVRNVFVCWTVFTTALSVTYYFRMSRQAEATSTTQMLAYMWLAVGLGWGHVPAAVGNWDNALFVGIPALLAGLSFEPESRRFVIAVGITLAYGLLTYPELFPIGVALAAPYYLIRLLNDSRPRLAVAWSYLQILVVAALILAPAGWIIWDYLSRQLAAGASAEARPGGGFSGGLVLRWWDPSAWWGLGAEHLYTTPWDTTVGVALTLVALIGLANALRTPRHPRGWAALMLLAMLTVVLGVQHYAYGVYKVLSVSWWLIAQLTLQGGGVIWRWIVERSPSFHRAWRLAATAAALALILASASRATATRRWIDYSPEAYRQYMPTLDELVTLRNGARLHANSDVLIAGKLVAWPTLPWVLYTLRSTPLHAHLEVQSQFPLFHNLVWTSKVPPGLTLRTSDERPPAVAPLIDTPLITLLDGRR